MLEHVSTEHGKIYLDEISKNKNILKAIEKFKENDKWGNPRLVNFQGLEIFCQPYDT